MDRSDSDSSGEPVLRWRDGPGRRTNPIPLRFRTNAHITKGTQAPSGSWGRLCGPTPLALAGDLQGAHASRIVKALRGGERPCWVLSWIRLRRSHETAAPSESWLATRPGRLIPAQPSRPALPVRPSESFKSNGRVGRSQSLRRGRSRRCGRVGQGPGAPGAGSGARPMRRGRWTAIGLVIVLAGTTPRAKAQLGLPSIPGGGAIPGLGGGALPGLGGLAAQPPRPSPPRSPRFPRRPCRRPRRRPRSGASSGSPRRTARRARRRSVPHRSGSS